MSFRSKGLSMLQSAKPKQLPTIKAIAQTAKSNTQPKNKVWFCDDDKAEKLGYLHTVTAIHFLSEEKKLLTDLKGSLNQISEKKGGSYKYLEKMRARSISANHIKAHNTIDIYKGFQWANPRLNKKLTQDISKKIQSSRINLESISQLDNRNQYNTESKMRINKSANNMPLLRHFMTHCKKERSSPLDMPEFNFQTSSQSRKITEMNALKIYGGITNKQKVISNKPKTTEMSTALGRKQLEIE